MDVESVLNGLVERYNSKIPDGVRDLDRIIILEFTDDDVYYLHLKNGALEGPMKVKPEGEGEIGIRMSSEVFESVLSGKMSALTAYMSRKISVDASLMDKLLLMEMLKK